MPTNKDISELFERYTRIEHEIKLLQDDRKQLLADFKDRLDPKTFQSALRSAKIKAKVKPQAKIEFDQILSLLEDEMCIEHIE